MHGPRPVLVCTGVPPWRWPLAAVSASARPRHTHATGRTEAHARDVPPPPPAPTAASGAASALCACRRPPRVPRPERGPALHVCHLLHPRARHATHDNHITCGGSLPGGHWQQAPRKSTLPCTQSALAKTTDMAGAPTRERPVPSRMEWVFLLRKYLNRVISSGNVLEIPRVSPTWTFSSSTADDDHSNLFRHADMVRRG